MRNRTEIRISGFGGQGVILSAIVIGKAGCIFESGFSTMTQAFGPEARGGACCAKVTLSSEPILYPCVTRRGILVSTSQEAYSLFILQLKDDGILIIGQGLVRVERLPHGVRVYGEPRKARGRKIREAYGTEYHFGFFAAVTNVAEPDSIGQAVADSVPPPGIPRVEPEGLRQRLRVRYQYLSADFENEEQPIEVSTASSRPGGRQIKSRSSQCRRLLVVPLASYHDHLRLQSQCR
jgi:2-oxoglutarate ferredoxin oxidoreductase subunit gamma